jgi:hypothetical protein
MKYIAKSVLTFLGFYSVIYTLIVILIMQVFRSGGASGSINTSFYIAGAIFIFAFISSSYKQLFNNLLIFGNTRKSMFVSSSIAYAVLSVLIALVSTASLELDRMLIASRSVSVSDLLNLLYQGNNNAALKFVWFLAFFLLVSAFSMLFGSLAYKWGKVFMTAFWVGSGFLLMFLPAVTDPKYLVNALGAFFYAGSASGLYLAPINFIVAAVILGAGTWTAMRKQPQVA